MKPKSSRPAAKWSGCLAALTLFIAVCLSSPPPIMADCPLTSQRTAASQYLPMAGWLVWQSPRITPPPENETMKTVDEILELLPENAVKPGGTVSKPVNMLFIARQTKIRTIMKKAGWAESSESMLEFIGDALMNLSSGKKPVKSPPVSKLYVSGKHQDMNFAVSKSSGSKAGIRRDGIGIIRIWRLPYSVSSPASIDLLRPGSPSPKAEGSPAQRPRCIPAWCATMSAGKRLDSFKSAIEKVLASEKSKVYFMPSASGEGLPLPDKFKDGGLPRDSAKQKILVLEIND